MGNDLIYRDVLFFKLTQISVFLPRFSFNAEYNSFIFIFNELKSLNVQTFQLIEINFRFVENVKFPAITLHNLLISRNRVQLNG